MKRFALLGLAVLSLLAFAPADSHAKGRIGPEGAIIIPFSDWSDFASIGFGPLARFEWWFNDNMAVTGRTGFVYHLKKNNVSSWEIPLLAGFRYTFDFGMFLEPALGFTHIKRSAFGFSSSDTKASLEFGAGYEFSNVVLKGGLYFPSVGDLGDIIGLMVTAGYQFDIF